MSITKASLPQIRKDINAALATIEKKHNLRFSIGAITYEVGASLRTKLEAVSTADHTGNAINPDKIKFEKNAWRVGVKKDAFGQTFTSNRKHFTITGLNTRAPKYPIQAVTASGKRYKFPVSHLPSSLQA